MKLLYLELIKLDPEDIDPYAEKHLVDQER